MKRIKTGFQAMSMEVLDPEEETTLEFIKNKWESKNHKQVNFKEIAEEFLEKKYGFKSEEKARQIAHSLFRKGQILIDIRGRERLCRPNHVTVYSHKQPEDFRNITIIDEETNFPTSRVWFSVFKEKNQLFLNITESKRTKQGWKTVNNIMIPPEATDSFIEMSQYINSKLKNT